MQQIPESELFHACRVLFGSELHLSREFLNYLQPSGVRSAYRKKALDTHPDRFASSSTTVKAKQEKLFQSLNQAHETVQNFLKQRNKVFNEQIKRTQPHEYSRPYANRSATKQSHLYSGPLPSRPLQLGQYLYYRGLVPYAAVISAITWQRRQRPSLGEIARRWRWLDDQDIERILKLRGGFSRFGERAERLGLLNQLQVRTLLLHQRTQQQQIGRYFVENDYITEQTLDTLLKEFSEHNHKYRHTTVGQSYNRS